MSTIDDGGPAFPVPAHCMGVDGMSLLDWYAGQCLALAHADYQKGIHQSELKAMFGERCGLERHEIVAAIASKYAAAMLAERNKRRRTE